ncbi:MAG: CxxxxCH/CxxCH domain-containing protein [Myxococcales bacterium]|nr:CxxxxCH/CxxCH domain-containing protein [Myxococcales bacterium]
MTCGSCHGAPPATPAHSNPALECSTCHGPGYSAAAKTVNKALHINGVVNTDQGGLTCTSCHGDVARAGIAKADAQLKSSPPLSTKGETATTARAVGAHQAHVNKSDITGAPLACKDCHVVPTSMAHSDGVVGVTFGAMAKSMGAAPSWNGTTCASSYCHGNFPGGATTAAPAWTGGAMACNSCHGTPPATPAHSNPSLECSTCHGAGYSATAKTVAKATHIDGVVNVSSSSLTCSSCHGDGARVAVAGADPQAKSAPPLGTKGETAISTRAVGAHVAHVNKGVLADPVACNECHVVPISNSHSDNVVQVAFGALAKTGNVAPAWNGTTCASSYCHGNFPGGTTTAAPLWTGGAMACNSCHGLPPTTPAHSNPLLECSTCHGAGYSATAKTVVKATHVDGVVNVNESSLSCSSCHGDSGRVGVSGADLQVKSAPPLGSKGETAASTRAVGAHQGHVNKGVLADPIACNECHVVPISGAHSDGVVQIAFGTLAKSKNAVPAWNGATCASSYCHGNFPGGTTTAAPSWTGGVMACNACHGLPPATPAHSNPALACSGCHGPGYSATAQTVNKATHVNGVVNVDLSAMNCNSCHGDTTRVGIAGADSRLASSPPLGSKGETATTTRAVGAHQAHLNKATFADTPIACNECHAVPTSNGHSDGTAQVAFGPLAKTGGAAPTWNGTTCSNVYCHGSFTGGATLFQPAWAGGTVTCGSCHGTPPQTGDHGRHPNNRATCADCHGSGYVFSAASKTVNKVTHMNGVKDVAGSKITNYDKATRRCSTSCHGAETW